MSQEIGQAGALSSATYTFTPAITSGASAQSVAISSTNAIFVGQKLIVDLPSGDDCEISVKRSLFDDLLLRRAGALGADVREQTTVSGLSKNGDWKIETVSGETFQTRMLIGADGRNSTSSSTTKPLSLNSRIHVP